MVVLSAVTAMVALVLAVGAVAKLADPRPTRELLAGLGLPAPRPAPYVLGAAELGVAVAVLGTGARWATFAMAALYAGFAALVAVALARGTDGVSCGCFGRWSSPPSALHLVANLASTAVALAAAVAGAPRLGDELADQPLAGVPLLALVVLGAGLLVAITTVLPDALAAARRPAGGSVTRFHLTTPDREVTP